MLKKIWTAQKKISLLFLICVILTELALRVIFGLGSPVLIRPEKSEAEGGYGYIPAPDQDIFRFFAHNKINHFSMRSEDIHAHKTPGHVRILFIGDSVTYGTTYIDQSKIFTTQISQNLTARIGRPVDVLNVSAGGWAASNEINFLKSKGTFDADIVLIVLNTGDLNQQFSPYHPSIDAPVLKPLSAIGETWSRYVAPRLFGAKGGEPDPGSRPNLSNISSQAVLNNLAAGHAYAIKHKSKFGIVFIPAHGGSWV